MTERVFVEHDGMWHDPARWPTEWSELKHEDAERRRRVLREGTFVSEDGEPLPPVRARFLRAEIMGTYASVPRAYDPTEVGPVRAYVPGLMNHGTIPMLGGPPKGGRSTFVHQLAASLIIPDRRFLGVFEPAQMNEIEARRHVWLLNGENPADEVHEDLLALGLEYDPSTAEAPFYSVDGVERVLFVEHLDALGGGDVFDMTSDEQREFWEYRILKATNGGPTPLTVIADGVTAMLNADTTRYGRWFSGFKKLLRALDVPNGLAVGHTGLSTGHLMNGVESMAGPDGLWVYDAKEPDKNPDAPRYFWTTPRLRGPRVDRSPVILGDDGMLRLFQGDPGRASTSGAGVNERRLALLAKLREAGTKGSMTTALTGDSAEGQLNRKELDRMLNEGLVTMQKVKQGRGRGMLWWLTEFAPPA